MQRDLLANTTMRFAVCCLVWGSEDLLLGCWCMFFYRRAHHGGEYLQMYSALVVGESWLCRLSGTGVRIFLLEVCGGAWGALLSVG